MPSGSGRATGILSTENFDKVEALSAWADEHDHSLLELAFAWQLTHPVVSSVIAGATTAEQVASNAAAGSLVLSPKERAEVDGLVA